MPVHWFGGGGTHESNLLSESGHKDRLVTFFNFMNKPKKLQHYFVYYLLDPESGQVIYVGRSHRPKKRKTMFEWKYEVTTTLGVCQRFTNFEKACEAEREAIRTHRPKYNKKVTSSAGRLGVPASDITKHKIGAANLGRKLSEVAKKKISIAKAGKPGTWIGRHHSNESRAKISIGHLGKKDSTTTKELKRKSALAAWALRKGA